MTDTNKPPPELQTIAQLMDAQPEDVRELFHYALAMLMVEDGKAEITERHHVDNLEYLTIKTTAGDVRHSHADVTLAGKLLGYEPMVNLREGLKRTLEWYRGMPHSPRV